MTTRYIIRLRFFYTISRRLESRCKASKEVIEALRKFNRENKLQFGELVNNTGVKRKMKNKFNEDDDSGAKHLPVAELRTSKEVAQFSSTSPGALSQSPNNARLGLKNQRLQSVESKIHSQAEKDLEAIQNDQNCTRKTKASEQKCRKVADSTTLKKSASKKSVTPRKKSAQKEGCPTDNPESRIKKKREKSNEPSGKKNENIGRNVNDGTISTSKVESTVQYPEEEVLKVNDNVDNNNFDHSEDVNEITNSNPLLSYPLLNKSKKMYQPDHKYIEASSLHSSYYPYPSVSHILGKSMSPSSEINLQRWKKNLVSEMGDEEFETYSKTLMHSARSLRQLILSRLRGVPDEKLDITPDLLGCWESLKFVFPLFPKVKDIGKIAVHPELKYKGMVDSLIEFRDKLVLVNWKKANKYVPSLDKTYDFPIQCAAYMGAINFDPSFPFLVDEALLVLSYTNGMKADIFHLKVDKCQHYWEQWLERLNAYRMRMKENDPFQLNISDLGKLNIEEELARIQKFEVDSKLSDLKTESNTLNITPKKAENSNFIHQEPNALNMASKETENSDSTQESNSLNILPKETENSDFAFESESNFPLYNDEKIVYNPTLTFQLDNVNQAEFKSCPAVTTILSETKSPTAIFLLERWKTNMIVQLGVEGFEAYQKNILSQGILFHKLVQNYFNGMLEDIPDELKGCWSSLRNVFPLISDVKLTETRVVHEKLKYKGIVDCIAEFQGKLVVIDWKKSDKLKSTINMTYDAPLQIAAYIGALNYDSKYPVKVEEGLLIISYMDGSKADVYHLDTKNCRKYWDLWLQRVRKYRNDANKNSTKIEY